MIIIKTALAIVTFHLLHHRYITKACCEVENVSGNEGEVIDSIHELGRKLSYAQWVNSPTANVILSPLSITIILNLLLLGTDGDTKSEIEMALNYPNNLQESDLHNIYKNIFTCLNQSEKGVEISLLTRIFAQEGFQILDSFTSVAKTSYFSDVKTVDFFSNPVVATEEINSWVSESTKGKIEKVFTEPLESDTVSVFVNVIFFNATWKYQFSNWSTEEGTFYSETGNINIPMMNAEMQIPYLMDSSKGIEMISLPYEGDCYSMYILKPIENSGINLQQVEETLTANELDNLINLMGIQTVLVTIPRMRIDFELSLEKDLESFGINQVFNPGANFSRFTNEENLYVSKIIHKAILEVTEVGTVAAAVTAAVITFLSATYPPPPHFELNRPSLLFIRDNQNGLLLFWTRLEEPQPIVD